MKILKKSRMSEVVSCTSDSAARHRVVRYYLCLQLVTPNSTAYRPSREDVSLHETHITFLGFLDNHALSSLARIYFR